MSGLRLLPIQNYTRIHSMVVHAKVSSLFVIMVTFITTCVIIMQCFSWAYGIVPPSTAMDNTLQRDDLIRGYFSEGLPYALIVQFLQLVNGITISLSGLKKILKRLGFSRRRNHSAIGVIRNAVREEIHGSGRNLGYRAMAQVLMENHNLNTSRQEVQGVLREIDPNGVLARLPGVRRRARGRYWNGGPNSKWHLDGYDKLSPFGIYIHGCIDGFSRRIIWLTVSTTNKDPAVVAGYYTQAVRELNGLPVVIRADCGVENILMCTIHSTLRRNGHEGGRQCFWFGASTENTRIEGWWSFLRRHRTGYWIDLFKGLVNRGLYTAANVMQREVLKFCFIPLIQQEMDRVARHWNQHKIRANADAPCPDGRPNQLFFIPETVGSRNYLLPINMQEVDTLERHLVKFAFLPCCYNYFSQCKRYMNDHNLETPSTAFDALSLYLDLCNFFEN